ncbi:MAG: hypothetical protein Q7T62_05195 [Undibacterium sp.]|nr:hypothetical protein [Undibacterium sp.]
MKKFHLAVQNNRVFYRVFLHSLLLLLALVYCVQLNSVWALTIAVPPPPRPNALQKAISDQNEPIVKALLFSGADPESTGELKTSPLELAIRNRNTNIFNLLIEAGAGHQYTTVEWTKLFKSAVQGDELHLAKRLVQFGAVPKQAKAVFIDARSNDMRDFLLSSGVDPKEKVPHFGSIDALSHYVLHGDLETIEYLTQHVVYQKQELTSSIKNLLCQEKSSSSDDFFLEMTRKLIHDGAEMTQNLLPCLVVRPIPELINLMQEHGLSFVYSGAPEQHPFLILNPAELPKPEYLELLEQKGLKWDVKSHGPLMMAHLGFQSPELAIWLIQRGVNVNSEIKGTPTMIAFIKLLHQPYATHKLYYRDIAPVAAILLNAGANADARDENGLNALWWEIKLNNGRGAIASMLMAHGASANVHDGDGNWLVHLASHILTSPDTYLTFDKLLEQKLDWNVRDIYGRTPLHFMALTSSLCNEADKYRLFHCDKNTAAKIVSYTQILIDRGADIGIAAKSGKLPLDYLDSRSEITPNREIQKLLTK